MLRWPHYSSRNYICALLFLKNYGHLDKILMHLKVFEIVLPTWDGKIRFICFLRFICFCKCARVWSVFGSWEGGDGCGNLRLGSECTSLYITMYNNVQCCTVLLLAIRETPDCVGPGLCAASGGEPVGRTGTAVRSYNRHGDQSWTNRNGGESGPAPLRTRRTEPWAAERDGEQRERERDVTV